MNVNKFIVCIAIYLMFAICEYLLYGFLCIKE